MMNYNMKLENSLDLQTKLTDVTIFPLQCQNPLLSILPTPL